MAYELYDLAHDRLLGEYTHQEQAFERVREEVRHSGTKCAQEFKLMFVNRRGRRKFIAEGYELVDMSGLNE